jgi:hypothetical protein
MSDQEDAVIPGYATPLIDAARLDEIVRDCLVNEDAPGPDSVVIEGVVHTYAFQPAKLAEHRLEVVGMLVNLPIEFRPTEKGGGGGWSFLNACNDRRGEQWTGMHMAMENLFVLGIANGDAEWQLPRDVWSVLPGGMPYVAVKV